MFHGRKMLLRGGEDVVKMADFKLKQPYNKQVPPEWSVSSIVWRTRLYTVWHAVK